MRISNRRLLRQGDAYVTAPVKSVVLPSSTPKEGRVASQLGSMLGNTRAETAKAKSASKPAASNDSSTAGQHLEVADSVGFDTLSMSGNVNVSSVQITGMMSDLMDGYMPATNESSAHPLIYKIYRDIYYFDPIAGGAVDMFTNLPFSDFSLAGIKDEKAVEPFHKSLANMRIRKLLGQLSTEYLVNGLFIGEMSWDDSKKEFTGISPHDPAFATLESELKFGMDPRVTIDLASAQSGMPIRSGALGRAGIKSDSKSHVIPADNLLYMTRKGMFKDIRGLSYFKRILPIWFLEKALIRGTMDQSYKRQRSIAHMKVGSPEWTPSSEDMAILASMLSDAEMDPLGAILVTRDGVDVQEIRRGEDFWKHSDISDYAGTLKMKALGINEAILSGDATINTIEMAMSVFLETVKDHRDSITNELFYEKTFPKIAEAHGITRSRYKEEAGMRIPVTSSDGNGGYVTEYVETASSFNFDGKFVMPSIHWHKSLKPESDSAYMEILTTLEEKGVPLPLRMWAAAGGIDLTSILEGLGEDAEVRKKIAAWRKANKVQAPGPEGSGGEEDDDGFEGASDTSLKPVGLNNRSFAAVEDDGILNIGSDGKRHTLSASGKKHLVEKVHKRIAEAAVITAEKENRKLKAKR